MGLIIDELIFKSVIENNICKLIIFYCNQVYFKYNYIFRLR